jgi:DNA-binding transcriptional LysR family regulator
MDVLRLTLRQLQTFVAVARSGSTTAASGEIALSQSATSAAVLELERVLARPLFDRAGKRLLLNVNGRALLPRAEALLDGAAAIEQMTQDTGRQLQSLRIGASTTIGSHVLPGELSTFLRDEPRAAVSWRSGVFIGNTADVCARVASFALDIGLIEGPAHGPDLRVHPWIRDEMVIVGVPTRTRSEPALTVKQLRDEVWLLREPGSGTRETADQALLPQLHAYRRSIELGSSEAIKRAAAAGLGIACLSRWVVSDWLEVGRLREIRTTLPRIVRQCYWVMHRDKKPTPMLQRLLARLQASSTSAQ